MLEPRSRQLPKQVRPDDEFASAVIDGLSRPNKTLPCRFFYDARGSDLFEEITRLPEYYLTRTETGILERYAAEMAAGVPAGAVLVEFGSGSSRKTEILLARAAASWVVRCGRCVRQRFAGSENAIGPAFSQPRYTTGGG